MKKFQLTDHFMESYIGKQPKWGFDGLGYVVYKRTYARLKEDGTTEEWWETICRVVEGCYDAQIQHCVKNLLPFNYNKGQVSAQKMYDLMFNMKFLPAGRGLQHMGSPSMYATGGMCLYNCSFVTTENIDKEFSRIFTLYMMESMLGVGVSGDTRGEGKVTLKQPSGEYQFDIEDSRFGWCDSLEALVDAFWLGKKLPKFNYDLLRPAGAPLKTFGGYSSGPEALRSLHAALEKLFTSRINHALSSVDIADIFNLIGKCVVAGGTRRTATLLLGYPSDENFLSLKDPTKFPEELKNHRWASNNTVLAYQGMDYDRHIKQFAENGEPGFYWLDNAQHYGRMKDGYGDWDLSAIGENPCFSGDTLVAVADGRGAVPIKQLATEGKDVPVYSLNPEGMVEIKWGRNPRVTGLSKKLFRVFLDSGSYVDVTENHKFLLRDGTEKTTLELKYGDSLPRLNKRLESMRRGGSKYWRLSRNTLDQQKDKIFEHKLIAQFTYPKLWNSLYTESKQNGWHAGGIVVHHINFDSTDNAPSNLEIMTFKDHRELHVALSDVGGEKNPMWGREHSKETKDLIAAKVRDRCADPAYMDKLRIAQSTPANRSIRSKAMSKLTRQNLKNYFTEMEKGTDLTTKWINDYIMMVIKKCEICGTELRLPWSRREASYCSISCANKNKENIEYRRIGRINSEKGKLKKDNQINIFLDLKLKLGRKPLKTEWVQACKEKDVPHRLNGSRYDTSFKKYTDLALASDMANHRIVKIIDLGVSDTVFNITVDDNHTVGIVTEQQDGIINGIFTSQCGEVPLESKEKCNVADFFPANHESLDDLENTLKYAYLYCKSVSLIPTHDPEVNAIVGRNRRIGLGPSGVIQAVEKFGYRKLMDSFDRCYPNLRNIDKAYSRWLCIPTSIKMTTVKPNGTTSLLAGSTPGMHWPHSEYHIRNVRFELTSPLLPALEKAGYKIEDSVQKDNTKVVSFPVKINNFRRSKFDVSAIEQLELAAALQYHWSDNSVSCTCTFRPDEVEALKYALPIFENRLKSISFLPLTDHKYKQAPYIEITEEEYTEMTKDLKKISFKKLNTHEVEEAGCTTDICELRSA